MGELIEFPKVVKVASLWNEGLFGWTIDTIREIKVYESSILIWFNEGSENNRPWDLSLKYSSNEEAEDSYSDMLSAMREIRFNQLNTSRKKGRTHKED